MVEDILLLGPGKQRFRGRCNHQINKRVSSEFCCRTHTKIYAGYIQPHEHFASCTKWLRPIRSRHCGTYLKSTAGWGAPHGRTRTCTLKPTGTQSSAQILDSNSSPEAHVRRSVLSAGSGRQVKRGRETAAAGVHGVAQQILVLGQHL